MKSYLYAIFILLVLTGCDKKSNPIPKSSQQEIASGLALFEGKGMCAACHKAEIKTVGPSINEIALTYKNKKASIASFINDETKPLIDELQFEIMKTNFKITKAMTPKERLAIEAYIMSFAK
jgi:cytochrome c